MSAGERVSRESTSRRQPDAVDAAVDLLFRDSAIGRCLVGPDGTVARVNPEWLRWASRSEDDVLGAPIETGLPASAYAALPVPPSGPEASTPIDPHVRDLGGPGTIWAGRIDAIGLGGGISHLITVHELDYAPEPSTLPDMSQSLAGVRLSSLIDTIPVGVIFADRDGRITFANEAAQTLVGGVNGDAGGPVNGYTLHQSNGRPFAADELPLSRALRGQVTSARELLVRRAQYGDREVVVDAGPVLDEDGAIVGAVAIMHDVTAQKQAERALRDSEERFRDLANNISQLAWMADEHGSIFWYNARWFEYTGETPEAMLGWGWRAVHHPDHVDRVVEKISHAFAAGEPWEDLFPLRGRDGRYCWFLSRAVPIRDRDGRVTRWFGTNTDVTAQRDAEQAVRAADRRKDEFIAILSHELRNPLAPIRFALPVLERESLTAAGKRALTIVDRQVDQLARLLDDLLDASRITRGKLELRRKPVALDGIIRTAVDAVTPMMTAGRHDVECVITEQPIWVDGDPVRLTQVLTNLLTNSARYTPRGGRIAVESARDDGAAIIRVRDTGIGIPHEALPTIFEMFRQVDRPDHPQGGLGIGLALSKRLGEMHGGTIEVRSDGAGRGSEFTVRLPLAPVAIDEHRGTDPAQIAPRRRLRVLVVDDNADLVEMLTLLVRERGHEVRHALDGETAIAAALAFQPDVALLDLGLPVRSGLDVARELRRHPKTAATRLIAITGWGQAEDRARTREAGFDAHLTKPIDPATVSALLTTAASSSYPSSPADVGRVCRPSDDLRPH